LQQLVGHSSEGGMSKSEVGIWARLVFQLPLPLFYANGFKSLGLKVYTT